MRRVGADFRPVSSRRSGQAALKFSNRTDRATRVALRVRAAQTKARFVRLDGPVAQGEHGKRRAPALRMPHL